MIVPARQVVLEASPCGEPPGVDPLFTPAPGDGCLPGVYQRSRKVVAVLFFPVVITASMVGSAYAMNRGVSVEAVTGVAIFLSYVYLATLERFFPLHPQWSRSHGDVGPDLALGATNAIVNFGTQPVFLAIAAGLSGWVSTEYGAGIWPTQWPLLVQLVPALLLGELVEYTCHRAMHENAWLWPIHAPHHSAKRLYWLNAVRFHPIDVLLIGPSKLIPLVALGASPQVMGLVLIFAAVHGSCQHANIPCRIAELHRWHHSQRASEANHNYGGNLIFWDWVFGSRWLPADREPPVETGIEELPHFPASYAGLMAAPFRWRNLVTESGPRAEVAGGEAPGRDEPR